MIRSRLAPVLVACALALTSARADDKVEHGFVNKVYKDADGKESKYVVFVPHPYQAEKPYPVVLFLHGAGSTGDDGKKQVSGIAAEIPVTCFFPSSPVEPDPCRNRTTGVAVSPV